MSCETKESKAAGEPRYCQLCRFQREKCQATATEFMQSTFKKDSSNVLDYSTDCFALSLSEKRGLSYEG